MKIGVVSDTHNNLKNIEIIINLFNDEKVSLVIHTGDVTNAKSLEKFSTLNGEFVGVYGNNDRNELNIKETALKNNFNFKEPPSTLILNHRKIAIFHEPEPIEQFLLENRNIDMILHGHTHRYRNETKNGILYFNPGESAGMQKGSNAIGIIDLNILEAKRIFF
tara:strand:- start:196 stop:687 length:492 start_codon:yes stop_codon:yes gene_type:complete